MWSQYVLAAISWQKQNVRLLYPFHSLVFKNAEHIYEALGHCWDRMALFCIRSGVLCGWRLHSNSCASWTFHPSRKVPYLGRLGFRQIFIPPHFQRVSLMISAESPKAALKVLCGCTAGRFLKVVMWKGIIRHWAFYGQAIEGMWWC